MAFNKKRLGIDLGTANSLVYLAGEGIVMDEPTVVALNTKDKRVLAVGNEAKEMLGRAPDNITVSRPLREGVIADYAITEALLRFFFDKVIGRSRFFKPEVMVCVPAGVTGVERRAVVDAAISAGAQRSYLIDEPLAAAIGAQVPIAAPSGNMVVDIGGGSTDVAVISLGGVVVRASERVAGDRIDQAIASYVRRQYDLIIGEQMAEKIKIGIGSALPPKEADEKGRVIEIRGRDAVAGLPRHLEVTEREISGAVQTPLARITSVIREVLEKTPPELSSDIIERGIVLTGGTAKLGKLDRLITKETGVPSHVTDEPLLSVVRGTGIALENLDLYKHSITSRR